MFNIKKICSCFALGTFLLPSLFSCSNNDGYIVLKVLNSEDYIYKYDASVGGLPDLTTQFENYMLSKGKKVRVVYDTFDTMENMYNTLKTGKTKYDLVCASEYMIQKLSKNKLIMPLDIDNQINNYSINASPFIRDKFKNIKFNIDSSEVSLDEYCICYMWGTLGIIYNPTFETFVDKHYSIEEISKDMETIDSLWGENNNSKYKKTISIKDSMRDTYAIGLIHKYASLLEGKSEEERNVIFNYGGENDTNASTHIEEIKNDLLKLRNNIFGFEVDSGKEDIVTGKIGINVAWSGDAVHSINTAENEKNIKLYYSLPKEGANLWFDCWCMQNSDHNDISYEFLNFISDPNNAIQNMSYIGFTSAIASEETFNYFKEKYTGTTSEKEDYDLNYFFKQDQNDLTDYKISIDSINVNRAISAQFPNKDYISKLMVMKDFGSNNDLVLKMWEEVKHDSLPVWAIVLFSIEIAAILGGITTYFIIKYKDLKLRRERKITIKESK